MLAIWWVLHEAEVLVGQAPGVCWFHRVGTGRSAGSSGVRHCLQSGSHRAGTAGGIHVLVPFVGYQSEHRI